MRRHNALTLGISAIAIGCYGVALFRRSQRHVPWFDEAQAWLLATKTDLRSLIFKELRYEGHPALWHLMLKGTNRIVCGYGSLKMCGTGCAILSVVLLTVASPFPWWLRLGLPFSYYLGYQYAVVNRPYNVIVTLVFLFSIIQRAGFATYWKVLVLTLLTHTSFHGTLLSLSLAAIYIGWPMTTGELSITRGHLFLCILYISSLAVCISIVGFPGDRVSSLRKTPLAAQEKVDHCLNQFRAAFVREPAALWLFGVSVVAWCLTHGAAVPMFIVLAPQVLFSVLVYGMPWHFGLLNIAYLSVTWIHWGGNRGSHHFVDALVKISLGIMVASQYRWLNAAVRSELTISNSGAASAATFLNKAVKATEIVDGISYNTVSIKPYLRRLNFRNQVEGGVPYFWRWSSANRINENWRTLLQDAVTSPDYVVYGQMWITKAHAEMARLIALSLHQSGYRLVHIARGSFPWQDRFGAEESFWIFRKSHRSCQLGTVANLNDRESTPR